MDIGGGFETEEVLCEILKRLPVKYLLRFMCVSKPWNHLITDPFFVTFHLKFNKQSLDSHSVLGITIGRDYHGKFHHKQLECFRVDKTKRTTLEHLKIEYPWKSSLNQDKNNGYVEILGHCNGLICARAYQTPLGVEPKSKAVKTKRYVICNPITRTFRILPVSDIDVPDLAFEEDEDEDNRWRFRKAWLEKSSASGFGFIDDHVYKVVVVTYGMVQLISVHDVLNSKPYEPLWLEVYDSISGSWRRVSVDPHFSYDCLSGGTYNCFDKCLYFFGRGCGKRKCYFTIVSFDLVEEKWNETLLPYKSWRENDYDGDEVDDQDLVDDIFGRYGYCQGVDVLGESVVVFVGDQRNTLVRSVWKMNKEKDKISWTHMYRFNFGGSPIGFCRNGELLLMMKTLREKDWRKLVLHDSNKMNEDCFGFTNLDFRVGVIVPDFVESLILLDGEREGIEDVSDDFSKEQGKCALVEEEQDINFGLSGLFD